MHWNPLSVAFVAIHGFLGLWAAVGLLEWFSVVPWPRITNPDLPRGLLLLHWLAMLGAAAAFLGGVVARWSFTPTMMVAAYGGLALICAYETFFVLKSPMRFVSMAIEYATYTALLLLLHGSRALRATFTLTEGSR